MVVTLYVQSDASGAIIGLLLLLFQGIGEPPLLLSCAVFFAIKNAIKSARVDAGLPLDDFVFNSPATVGKILLACSTP